MNQTCRDLSPLAEPCANDTSSVVRVSEPTVSGLVAQSLVEVVEDLGVPRARFLDEAHLSEHELAVGAQRMPRGRFFQLCSLASALTGVPALGLRWAERLRESSYFPVSNLVVHAPNVREALAALRRYSCLLSDNEPYAFVESGDEITIRFCELSTAPLEVTRCLAEMTLLALVLHLRRTRMDGALKRASFAYPAPSYRDEYARTLGGLERFGARYSELVFDARQLRESRVAANDEMLAFLLATAERQRKTLGPRLATQVLQILAWECNPMSVQMADVASILRISVRTLRRRLEAEGTPYPQVRATAHSIVAKQLIRDQTLSLRTIAGRLGYTTVRGFYRAFRRWNGTTPGAYRRAFAPRVPEALARAD